MSFFDSIIYALQTRADSPASFGLFHLLSAAVCILLTVGLSVFCRNVKSKTFRIIVAVAWAVMIIFEVYKQLVFSFSFDGTTATWSYQWYIFPFQLCSTPLYVLPFVAFLKDGKVRDGFMAFASTFSLFGGLCVMVFPNDVFATDLLGVQIQTMVHHGLQLAIGIFIAVYNRKSRHIIRNFISAVIIFIGFIAVALIMNFTIPLAIGDVGFSMFYVSPYEPCILPILNMVYPLVPFVVFALIYIIGFIIVALIIWLVIVGLSTWSRRSYIKAESTSEQALECNTQVDVSDTKKE